MFKRNNNVNVSTVSLRLACSAFN